MLAHGASRGNGVAREPSPGRAKESTLALDLSRQWQMLNFQCSIFNLVPRFKAFVHGAGTKVSSHEPPPASHGVATDASPRRQPWEWRGKGTEPWKGERIGGFMAPMHAQSRKVASK